MFHKQLESVLASEGYRVPEDYGVVSSQTVVLRCRLFVVTRRVDSEGILGKPTFKQVLMSQMNQVRFGKDIFKHC